MTDRDKFDEPRRRTVQDDVREEQLARQLDLHRTPGRTGSDARDEFDNRYELKTVTTSNVTTGRDIGRDYLDRLKRSYLICARGVNTDYGFRTDELYFLSPEMMADWIANIEARIGGDQSLVDTALQQLQESGFDGDIDRLRRICYRGFTLNNPKISWRYITSHGVRLDGQPALRLRELVAQFPIRSDSTPG